MTVCGRYYQGRWWRAHVVELPPCPERPKSWWFRIQDLFQMWAHRGSQNATERGASWLKRSLVQLDDCRKAHRCWRHRKMKVGSETCCRAGNPCRRQWPARPQYSWAGFPPAGSGRRRKRKQVVDRWRRESSGVSLPPWKVWGFRCHWQPPLTREGVVFWRFIIYYAFIYLFICLCGQPLNSGLFLRFLRRT